MIYQTYTHAYLLNGGLQGHRIQSAGIGDDANALGHDGGHERLPNELDKLGNVPASTGACIDAYREWNAPPRSRVSVFLRRFAKIPWSERLCRATVPTHGDFGEIISHQIVNVAVRHELMRRRDRIAPKRRRAADADRVALSHVRVDDLMNAFSLFSLSRHSAYFEFNFLRYSTNIIEKI
jgi:hypothetical protein